MPASKPRSSSDSSTGRRRASLPALEAAVARRRTATDERLGQFVEALRKHLGAQAGTLLGSHTCIYVVGSAGRGELTPESDLDLFLVRKGTRPSRLDAVVLQAAVLAASRAASFPDPSGDGEWLHLHAAARFVSLLGSRADDSENTFTARMLLLLESRPALGDVAYRHIVDAVIDAYWRNDDGNRTDYQPIVLLNDIVRYWRIVLLNYEAKNTDERGGRTSRSDPSDIREAKRRLRSYKLRFSRCLTCYSALTYFLALTAGARKPHVAREHVREMVAMSPLQRLIWVRRNPAVRPRTAVLIDDLLASYLRFLNIAGRGKATLIDQFQQERFRQARSREGWQFGKGMFDLVCALGRDSELFRWLVV